MLRTVLGYGAFLLLSTGVPAAVLLILVFLFRVDEDASAIYTSINLGILLFIGSAASTLVFLLYGISHCEVLTSLRSWNGGDRF